MSDEKQADFGETTAPIPERGLSVVDTRPIKRKPWWKFGGEDVSFVSVDAGYAKQVNKSASSSDTKLDELGRHVWETAESREIYKPIPGYEGAHRFDPSLTWAPEEEKRLVRQVRLTILHPSAELTSQQLDWRIALPACIMFFALQLDRGNITQAISDTMLGE